MYLSKVETQKDRARRRLKAFGLLDPEDPDLRLAFSVLSKNVQETAAVYTNRYLEITGITLTPSERDAMVEDIAARLLARYNLPVGIRWIIKGEEIAHEVYRTETDPAAHLGALSESEAHELTVVFSRIEEPQEAMRIVAKVSRLHALDAEILLTAVQQFRAQENYRWVEEQVERFNQAVGKAVRIAADQSATSEAQATSANQLVQDLLALTEDVAVASHESAAAMGEAASTAGGLRQTLSSMTSQLERATQALGSATGIAETTLETVNDLGSKSASVHSIARLIHNITERTNILALNARIEAARAGDAGRGFSVVASEIKGLSEQTAEATDEIVAHLEGIGQASKRALEANQSMLDTFTDVRDMTQAVCEEVTEQANTVTRIAASVDETAMSATASSEAIQSIRELIGGISDELSKATGAASELNTMIQRLQKGTANFIGDLAIRNARMAGGPHMASDSGPDEDVERGDPKSLRGVAA